MSQLSHPRPWPNLRTALLWLFLHVRLAAAFIFICYLFLWVLKQATKDEVVKIAPTPQQTGREWIIKIFISISRVGPPKKRKKKTRTNSHNIKGHPQVYKKLLKSLQIGNAGGKRIKQNIEKKVWNAKNKQKKSCSSCCWTANRLQRSTATSTSLIK